MNKKLDNSEAEIRAGWETARASLLTAMGKLKNDAEREMLAPLLHAVDMEIARNLAELKTLRENFRISMHALDLTRDAIQNGTLGIEN